VQLVAAVIVGGLVFPSVVPVGAEVEQGIGPEVWNILPPGQSGTVNAVELARVLAFDPVRRVAVEGRNAPPHFADQLERYDALNTVDPASLSAADLDTFYKRADLDVAPDAVARVERPRPGVTISWDRDGVPHVVGQSDVDVAFGAGWAGTRDRMFLQDVLRHVGAARAAEFLGPSAANIAMDVEQLRTAPPSGRPATRWWLRPIGMVRRVRSCSPRSMPIWQASMPHSVPCARWVQSEPTAQRSMPR
jgi:Penicillin amidase